MPNIWLDLQRVDYCSDQNANLTAWRIDAETLFTAPSGVMVRYSCVVDTGAPFSVLPYALWHGCNLQWSPCGTQLLRQGGKAYEPLHWRRVSCSLGETTVHLFDGQTNLQAGPFTIVGKFANRRSPSMRFSGALSVSGGLIACNKCPFKSVPPLTALGVFPEFRFRDKIEKRPRSTSTLPMSWRWTLRRSCGSERWQRSDRHPAGKSWADRGLDAADWPPHAVGQAFSLTALVGATDAVYR
jgi:hypothetical protein